MESAIPEHDAKAWLAHLADLLEQPPSDDAAAALLANTLEAAAILAIQRNVPTEPRRGVRLAMPRSNTHDFVEAANLIRDAALRC